MDHTKRHEYLVVLPAVIFLLLFVHQAIVSTAPRLRQPPATAAPNAIPSPGVSTPAAAGDTGNSAHLPAATVTATAILICPHCQQHCELQEGQTGICGGWHVTNGTLTADGTENGAAGDTAVRSHGLAAREAAYLYALPAPRDIPAITVDEIQAADLSLQEARYYQQLDNGIVRCLLCPFRCILSEGERGRCGVRANIDGRLRALTYGKPLTVNIDPIEKKPLYHFLPGSRAFSVATAGCDLGCIFCQNWEISQALPESTRHYNLSPEQLVAMAIENGCRSIAYTYTEPTVFYEYMLATAKLAREQGISNVWITCGYINEAPLRELCQYIDAANIDLKGFTEAFYREYCNASLGPVLRTLEVCHEEGVHVEVTNLVVPGGNDDPTAVRDMCRWLVDHLGPDVPLHFSRFFPKYRLQNRPPTPVSTLIRCAEIAHAEGINYVYVGNAVGTGWENTVCPTDQTVLIERHGYQISEPLISDGRCPTDGTAIPGRWQ